MDRRSEDARDPAVPAATRTDPVATWAASDPLVGAEPRVNRVMRSEAAKPWRETDLNRRTTARYRACLARGGHAPSGEMVEREVVVGRGYAPVALALCRRCAVPYGG